MNPLQEKRRALGHHRACFGGDSSSSSSQTTNNTYTDNRSVSNVSNDNHSTNIASGNTIGAGGIFSMDRSFNTNSFNTTTTNTNVTTTDHQAVQSALQSNATNMGLVTALTEKLVAGTQDVLKKNTQMAQELTGSTQQAYSNAAAQASGMNTFLFVAVGVVALAFIVLRK